MTNRRMFSHLAATVALVASAALLFPTPAPAEKACCDGPYNGCPVEIYLNGQWLCLSRWVCTDPPCTRTCWYSECL